MKTKDDLVKVLKDNKAPKGMLEWISRKESLDDILIECPNTYRIWALEKGLKRFEDDIKWDELSAFNARKLVRAGVEPAMSMMKGSAIVAAVIEDPKRFNKKVREDCQDKFTGADWHRLVSTCPDLAKYCKWDKMTMFQKKKLVQSHPEMLAYLPDMKTKENA